MTPRPAAVARRVADKRRRILAAGSIGRLGRPGEGSVRSFRKTTPGAESLQNRSFANGSQRIPTVNRTSDLGPIDLKRRKGDGPFHVEAEGRPAPSSWSDLPVLG